MHTRSQLADLSITARKIGKRRCCYGNCKVDERYPKRCVDVEFFPFPKPTRRLDDCLAWVKVCGRPLDELNPNSITKHFYVCSKHFIDGRPTEDNPFPLPFDGQPVKRHSYIRKLALRSKIYVPNSPQQSSDTEREPDRQKASDVAVAASFIGPHSSRAAGKLTAAEQKIKDLEVENILLRSRIRFLEAALQRQRILARRAIRHCNGIGKNQSDSEGQRVVQTSSNRMYQPNPEERPELKVEIDVAEESPCSWYMTEEHPHVSENTKISTENTDSSQMGQKSETQAVHWMKQEVITENTASNQLEQAADIQSTEVPGDIHRPKKTVLKKRERGKRSPRINKSSMQVGKTSKTQAVPCSNSGVLLTQAVPHNNNGILLTQAVPRNNNGVLLTQAMPHINNSVLLTQAMPHYNNGVLLTQAVPHSSNGVMLTQAMPCNNSGVLLTQAMPHNNNGVLLTQAMPHNNNGVLLAQGMPFNNNGVLLTQAVPSNNNGVLLTQSAPCSNNGVLLTQEISTKNTASIDMGQTSEAQTVPCVDTHPQLTQVSTEKGVSIDMGQTTETQTVSCDHHDVLLMQETGVNSTASICSQETSKTPDDTASNLAQVSGTAGEVWTTSLEHHCEAEQSDSSETDTVDMDEEESEDHADTSDPGITTDGIQDNLTFPKERKSTQKKSASILIEQTSETEAVHNDDVDGCQKKEASSENEAHIQMKQTSETQAIPCDDNDVCLKREPEVNTENKASIQMEQTTETPANKVSMRIQASDTAGEEWTVTYVCHSDSDVHKHDGDVSLNSSTSGAKEPEYHFCQQCDAKFAKSSYLKKHMVRHSRQKIHACQDCDAKFSHFSQLKKHMFIHSGRKLHVCQECDATFIRSGHLKNHMLIHAGEKSYVCQECDAKFTYADNLKKHMLIHSGQKPHACQYCDAKFSRSDVLKRHMVIHTRENCHVCQECGAKFSGPKALKNHMLIHTGQKYHTCQECGARFTRSNVMKKHMLSHIKKEPNIS